MHRQIAFFDFDGTITYKDTLLEFIRHSKGNMLFYTGFLKNSPWIVAYKLGLVSNQVAKEKVLEFFFRNQTLETFQDQCHEFTDSRLPSLLRPKALSEMAKLKARGFKIVVVSASPENWIISWANQANADLVATRLQTEQRTEGGEQKTILTGKILGANCFGEEKVRRIRQLYALEDYQTILCYGDSKGDLPMLQLSTRSFYKPFR